MALIFGSRSTIADNENALRDQFWPHAQERMWHYKESGGFVTIPKTLPFICRILDEISKNHPLGSTYQALWAFTWDTNAFVRLNRPRDLAYAAGFTGQRGERTLYDRLKRLADLGFIEVKPSTGNRFGFIFIPNPHAVIIQLHASRSTRTEKLVLSEVSYNAFLERALDIGCKDVKRMLQPQEQNAGDVKQQDPTLQSSGNFRFGPEKRRGRRLRSSKSDAK